MDTSLFEIPAVVVIAGLVCVVLVRAFAASRTDSVGVFRKADTHDSGSRP